MFEQRCPIHNVHLLDGCTCPLCKKEGRKQFDFSERDLLKSEFTRRARKLPILKKVPKKYPWE